MVDQVSIVRATSEQLDTAALLFASYRQFYGLADNQTERKQKIYSGKTGEAGFRHLHCLSSATDLRICTVIFFLFFIINIAHYNPQRLVCLYKPQAKGHRHPAHAIREKFAHYAPPVTITRQEPYMNRRDIKLIINLFIIF